MILIAMERKIDALCLNIRYMEYLCENIPELIEKLQSYIVDKLSPNIIIDANFLQNVISVAIRNNALLRTSGLGLHVSRHAPYYSNIEIIAICYRLIDKFKTSINSDDKIKLLKLERMVFLFCEEFICRIDILNMQNLQKNQEITEENILQFIDQYPLEQIDLLFFPKNQIILNSLSEIIQQKLQYNLINTKIYNVFIIIMSIFLDISINVLYNIFKQIKEKNYTHQQKIFILLINVILAKQKNQSFRCSFGNKLEYRIAMDVKLKNLLEEIFKCQITSDLYIRQEILELVIELFDIIHTTFLSDENESIKTTAQFTLYDKKSGAINKNLFEKPKDCKDYIDYMKQSCKTIFNSTSRQDSEQILQLVALENWLCITMLEFIASRFHSIDMMPLSYEPLKQLQNVLKTEIHSCSTQSELHAEIICKDSNGKQMLLKIPSYEYQSCILYMSNFNRIHGNKNNIN